MNLHTPKIIFSALCVFVLSAPLVLRVDAKGKNVTIDKNDQKTSIDCTGNAITVISDDNVITLKGECVKLTVKGKDNTVNAETVKEIVVTGTDVNVIVGTVGKINATGNDINIVWNKSVDGKPPKISTRKGADINIVHAGK